MPAVPLPLVSAAILVYLVVRSRLAGERPGIADAVLLLCALQAVLVTLNLHFGIAWAARLQPLTGVLIPPGCYLAWISLAIRPLERRDLLRHAAGPVLTGTALALSPSAVDVLTPTLYAGYGAALLVRLRAGADAVLLARLESGALPSGLWRGIGAMLIGSALSDVLISLAMVSGNPELGAWIVAAFTSVLLLGLGTLSLLRVESVAPDEADETSAVPEPHRAGDGVGKRGAAPQVPPDAEAREIAERARALLVERTLYRDPDLTIGRLARRLGVPSKRLSSALNRVEGCNVSQWVNQHRVEAACRELASNGGRVTEAMLEAGFRTKSNFNREFRRVTGLSPTEWLRRGPTERNLSERAPGPP